MDDFSEKYSSKNIKWKKIKPTEQVTKPLYGCLSNMPFPLYKCTRGCIDLYAQDRQGILMVAICFDNKLSWHLINEDYLFALSNMRNKLQSILISIKLMKDSAWKRDTMKHTKGLPWKKK